MTTISGQKYYASIIIAFIVVKYVKIFGALKIHSLLPTALAWEVMQSSPSVCPSVCFYCNL